MTNSSVVTYQVGSYFVKLLIITHNFETVWHRFGICSEKDEDFKLQSALRSNLPESKTASLNKFFEYFAEYFTIPVTASKPYKGN